MPKKQKPKNFMDELIHLTVHQDHLEFLPDSIHTFIEQYRDIEFYPNGLKRGKPFDKVKEAKEIIKSYVEKVKESEDNVECLIVGQLFELFNRMSAKEIRELHLEKLL